MAQPPRPRREGVIRGEMLFRAWIFLGTIEAALVLGGFFFVLVHGGWGWGDPTGAGSPLHDTYLQATTMTFAGIVACQVGTALAARTEHESLRRVGFFTNPLLLWGIAVEVAFVVAVVLLPPLQHVFSTRPLDPVEVAMLCVFPVVVWGADELRRYRRRTAPSV